MIGYIDSWNNCNLESTLLSRVVLIMFKAFFVHTHLKTRFYFLLQCLTFLTWHPLPLFSFSGNIKTFSTSVGCLLPKGVSLRSLAWRRRSFTAALRRPLQPHLLTHLLSSSLRGKPSHGPSCLHTVVSRPPFSCPPPVQRAHLRS